ncbi:MAG: hypothetical protein FWD75_02305 [Propionibacteriaceae bacterium]|nr:hypothetical protein [Propionibacteriaceae bacterium]
MGKWVKRIIVGVLVVFVVMFVVNYPSESVGAVKTLYAGIQSAFSWVYNLFANHR